MYDKDNKSLENPLLLHAGIIAEEVVEPLPPALVALSKRLVRWANMNVLLLVCTAHPVGGALATSRRGIHQPL